MKKKKKEKTFKRASVVKEPTGDVFEHFRKIIKQIQDDADKQYSAQIEFRKQFEAEMIDLQNRIRDMRAISENLQKEYVLLERKHQEQTDRAVARKKEELEKVRIGGTAFAEAQKGIREIERLQSEAKKKIETDLADLVKIAKDKEFEIMKLQLQWLNARDRIRNIETANRALAMQMLRDHATAEEKRISMTSSTFPDVHAERKKMDETIANYKSDGITFRDQINCENFLALRSLIFDVRIPKKFVPELQKLIDGIKDQEARYGIYLDDPYPRGEGIRLVETKKIKIITHDIEKEVKE